MLVGQGVDLFKGPKRVMLGQADTVQAFGFGRLDQLVHSHETIVGLWVAVAMQIN